MNRYRKTGAKRARQNAVSPDKSHSVTPNRLVTFNEGYLLRNVADYARKALRPDPAPCRVLVANGIPQNEAGEQLLRSANADPSQPTKDAEGSANT